MIYSWAGSAKQARHMSTTSRSVRIPRSSLREIERPNRGRAAVHAGTIAAAPVHLLSQGSARIAAMQVQPHTSGDVLDRVRALIDRAPGNGMASALEPFLREASTAVLQSSPADSATVGPMQLQLAEASGPRAAASCPGQADRPSGAVEADDAQVADAIKAYLQSTMSLILRSGGTATAPFVSPRSADDLLPPTPVSLFVRSQE